MENDLVQDIIQWDVKSWSKALTYWENNLNWDKIKNGLELGGREGGLSLWLALKGINVICSDLSNVKHTAQKLHEKYNVASQISYQDIDAAHIPYENYFDIIVFKSIIGGIGRDNNINLQKQAFQAIYKALKPGGKLLFAENLIASPIHQLFRKKFVNWGSSWRYVSIHDMNSFLNSFSSCKINTTGVLATFGRNEKQRKILTKFDEILLNKITPAHWKYICYGIAEK